MIDDHCVERIAPPKLPICVLMTLFSIGGWAQTPPQGWEEPVPERMAAEAMRSSSPTLYVEAQADFDGDGRTDTAALFLASDGSKEGLFVDLSSDTSREWILVVEIEHDGSSSALRMGIEVAEPGIITTACGKGYWECRPDEPAEISLEQAGIRYFRFEGAASVVYWEDAADELKRVWISD